MTTDTLPPSTVKRLVLNGALSIYDASAVKTELQAALEQADGVGLELDVANVTEIDLAGLQLLILARRECLRLQCDLRIVGTGEAVREAVSFCNLGDFFGPALVSAPSTPSV